MTLSKGSFLFRLFGKQNQAEAPTPKIAYCIPIAVMDHALFDEGAPLADITPDEKRDMTKAIGERLESIGWDLSWSCQSLNLRAHEYHRKLREMESGGGIFLAHIKSLIDRTYDYQKAKERMGRGVPQPFPIGAFTGCHKTKPGGAHE